MLKIGETLSPQEKSPSPPNSQFAPPHATSTDFCHPLYPTIKSRVYHFSYIFPPLLCLLLTYLGKCPPGAACSLTLLLTCSLEPSQKKSYQIPGSSPTPFCSPIVQKWMPSDCDTRHLFDKSQSLWEHPWIETLSLTCPHCKYPYASRASPFLWQDSCLTFSLSLSLPQTRLDLFTSDFSYLTSLLSFPPWIQISLSLDALYFYCSTAQPQYKLDNQFQ